MDYEITVIVGSSVIVANTETNATVGVQGPSGPQGPAGVGYLSFATQALMNTTVGGAGNIAYCLDTPDQWFKWSTIQNKWLPASF
jgi:hypothetical protein